MNLSQGEGMHSHNSPSLFSLTQLARRHRKAPTASEALLWRLVCHSQLGVRVRRQHVLHPYIVDFFVPAYRLVVEVDGAVHRGREACDDRRTAELERLYGVRVLRLEAGLVERDMDAAVAVVRAALGRR